MTRKKITKRVRRSAEDARREILDVAEMKLREHGPDGIRLQQIAQDVGISHPAVLHHFGSREGLMRAVVERALERLEFDLIAAIAAPAPTDKAPGTDLIDRAFDVLLEGGHARMVAWLLLSGEWNPAFGTRIRDIALAAHARRVATEDVEPPAPLEDTIFRMVLVALTIFGEAIAGDHMRRAAGVVDAGGAARFREWFSRLLVNPSDG